MKGKGYKPRVRKTSYRKYARKPKSKLAKKVAKLSRKIGPRVLNYKWITAAAGVYSSSIVLSSPLISLLNGIAQGTDENSRIGDLCRMHNMYLRLRFVNTSSSLSTFSFRVLIVREETALASAVSMSQLFNSSTPPTYDVRNVLTRNSKRFHVYYDKTFVMGAAVQSPAGATPQAIYNGAAPPEINVDIHERFRFVTDYSRGTAGTIADIDTNSLYLIVITDNTASGALACYGAMNLSFMDS